MKHSYILFLCALTLGLLSCEMAVNDSTLDFTVSRVRSGQAWVEIFPKSNDFYYIYDAVPVEEYNTFRNDRRFIEHHFDEQKEICKALNDLLKEYGYAKVPIEQMMFYNGAADGVLHGLEPNTDYYAFAYCLNSHKRPIHRLIKRPFTTPAKPRSDITFDVRMRDCQTLLIVPSNGDTYFWETASKAAVFNYYQADMNDTTMLPIWFAGVLYNNYQWDFQLATSDTTAVNLPSMVDNIADGDIFYLGCVGYTTEETTGESLYRITYHTSQPSVIEKIESVFDTPGSDAAVATSLNLLRRNPKRLSQASLPALRKRR
mgnify:FL=1